MHGALAVSWVCATRLLLQVTHDGDVTAGSIPEAPASGLPRS